MNDLFDTPESKRPQRKEAEVARPGPLAERLRPRRLSDVIGQEHLLGDDGLLSRMIREKTLSSIILWGPPGVGKTTIARLLSDTSGFAFVQINAIFTGVGDLKKIFEAARMRLGNGRRTLLFVDEIHRFNRAQQDAFLPYMEDGTIVLVGATTENPSFELNSALLSRASVLTLRRLDLNALNDILARVERELREALPLTIEARSALVEMADGDGRALINLIEQLEPHPAKPIDVESLSQQITRRAALYDKSGDEHYNLVSALHKSVRGSDPDAALYWLARMLRGGEDPRFIARRITRMAVEDIGLADPAAQRLCLDAWMAYERLGSPEGELALAEAVIYLALTPKSNSVYRAFNLAMASAAETGSLSPPKHILNAPTDFMKSEGFGAGYKYDHDAEGGFSGQNYFPEEMSRRAFYAPGERGEEKALRERLLFLEQARHKIRLSDSE